VGSHHPEGLLDAKMQHPAHAPSDMAAKGAQEAGQRAPGLRSPSSTARQVSRAALRNSCSSCSEEL
jgi:hypothetical protein